jgi:hypothetical protein
MGKQYGKTERDKDTKQVKGRRKEVIFFHE